MWFGPLHPASRKGDPEKSSHAGFIHSPACGRAFDSDQMRTEVSPAWVWRIFRRLRRYRRSEGRWRVATPAVQLAARALRRNRSAPPRPPTPTS